MTQEALKLALEALEDALNKPMWNRPQMTTAITAIKEALAQQELNFCSKCGKRTADLTTIHTCTPPQENT